MILFFIAGTQLPFPRMDKAIRSLLANNPNQYEIIYQSGQKENLPYKNLSQYNLMPEDIFINSIKSADLIIAHAGVGTLLECIELKKPVLMFPRQAKLKEHRNDHQLSTARKIHEIFQIPYYLETKKLVAAIEKNQNTTQGTYHYYQMKKNRAKLKEKLFSIVNEFIT